MLNLVTRVFIQTLTLSVHVHVRLVYRRQDYCADFIDFMEIYHRGLDICNENLLRKEITFALQ